MIEQQDEKKSGRGAGSFCITQAALNALIEANANAYEICTYLTLARFTDISGQYSTANISAVNRYTGANKIKGGPVDRAIQRLKTIHAKRTTIVSNGRTGTAQRMIDQVEDLGPILIDREEWCKKFGEPIPDGPTERAKILNILPNFGEPLADRIWFGGNLVTGVGTFKQPLKELKNAGDVAARLLLLLYSIHDMETWGGVCPVGKRRGPYIHFEPVGDDYRLKGGARLIRAKYGSTLGTQDLFSRAWQGTEESEYWWETHHTAGGPVFRALEALVSAGLIYEVVLVLNRNAEIKKFSSGDSYSGIPNDAEPLYELDCRTQHGFKPEGEEGIGSVTACTAGALGHSVTLEGGKFDHAYAAIVRDGYPAMLAGIYRLRFRVANVKNAGVKNAWARIHQNNRDAFDFIQKVRLANNLPALPNLATNKRKGDDREKLDDGLDDGQHERKDLAKPEA